MKNNLKSRDRNLVVQEFKDEILIYDRAANKAYCLNETAAFVWQSLDGETDVERIAVNLAGKTKCAVNEEIIWLAIERLKKDNLIANADELPNRFEGMNRREVVKRIGLATMIALPIVSTIVAPTAAHAASTVQRDCQTCSDNSECLSNNCARRVGGSPTEKVCSRAPAGNSVYLAGSALGAGNDTAPNCARASTKAVCCSNDTTFDDTRASGSKCRCAPAT